MLVKYKKYSIMEKINLEAYGLTEMNSESLVAIEGGYPNPTFSNLVGWAWDAVEEAASDFAEGFTEGFKAGVK
jgi:hypothetical protein